METPNRFYIPDRNIFWVQPLKM